MSDAHFTAKPASSEELVATSQTVDRLFLFINVPKVVQDHVHSTFRFSYLDRSVSLVQIFVNHEYILIETVCWVTRILRQGDFICETGRSFLTRRKIHASYMTHCESLQSIRILGFRTEKRYFYYKVDRNWYEGCRQTPWRQRVTTGSKIIIKIFYNNSTFHVLLLNRAKSVRVSSIQLLNHISPGLQEENAVLKKW